ncbi:hypothetical protein VPH35_015906 [Triticum aestivum]
MLHLHKPNQMYDILYYETLDIPLPELQGLITLRVGPRSGILRSRLRSGSGRSSSTKSGSQQTAAPQILGAGEFLNAALLFTKLHTMRCCFTLYDCQKAVRFLI